MRKQYYVEYGTTLHGRSVGFTPGSHDWERRELLVPASKPVRTVTLHALFRGHAGQVWFDALSAREVRGPSGAPVFEGVPVKTEPRLTPPLTRSTAETWGPAR